MHLKRMQLLSPKLKNVLERKRNKKGDTSLGPEEHGLGRSLGFDRDWKEWLSPSLPS